MDVFRKSRNMKAMIICVVIIGFLISFASINTGTGEPQVLNEDIQKNEFVQPAKSVQVGTPRRDAARKSVNQIPSDVKKPVISKDGNKGNTDTRSLSDKVADLEKQIQHLKYSTKRYPQVKFRNYKERKRILVTGGAGFVGSHLVDRLMMEGHEITVADNFFTGRRRNVEHWIGHENFELLNHDVVNPLYIEVDEVYHLASPASPPHYMYNPTKTIKANTIGTINMLGLATRCRAKFLFASTSEVYGDPQEHPQSETYWGHVNPNGPRACYDESKRVAETITFAYAQQQKVRVRIARIFNTFGPRMHMNDGRVVSNFILQALQGEPITLYGDGNQTRSFQYVSDLVDGLIALMNSNYSQPVNLGNPEEFTVEEFARLVKEITGSKSKIVRRPSQQDDPHRRKPDIRRAQTYLHWRPQISVREGVKRTIEYFSSELQRKRHGERNIWLSPELHKAMDTL